MTDTPELTPGPNVQTLPFLDMNDEELRECLSTYKISLTVDEARKVGMLLGRAPTITEAVIWGIQGSEHCSYKSSRRFLKNFVTKGKHIILGPIEDSGVVAITDKPNSKRWGLVITHESHNHPSQIVPFEGAATGIGGTVRDVLCMGARVIGCMDMLRLGDLKTEETKTIAKEVIRGIAGYGNPLGVPNLGGDTVFDPSYNSNCLVNAIALGIVREDEIIHSYVPNEAGDVGYDIILVGKPTDKSGFGGAAFASASMEEEKREQNSGAVQEPNPFLERHILVSTYALFDWLAREKKLDKVSYKDLGAGGVICASVEQVADEGFGAIVDLDKVHTALDGLPPEVIGCAETQERLCWVVHPDLTDHILEHYNTVWDLPSVAQNAGASVIGKVTKDSKFTLMHKGEIVCCAEALDITQGLFYERPTEEVVYEGREPEIECEGDHIKIKSLNTKNQELVISEVFNSMLAHPNGCSKSDVFRKFDKNVIGNTVLEAGEADAAVIAPLQDLQSYTFEGEHPTWELSEEDAWKGVALAADGNGRYGRISPYWQGANAAIESMYNVAAVGATPRALTDCLNYGNPEIPTQLWALEQGVAGIRDASIGFTFEGEPVPIISGNVSLYNGKPDGSAIDPTAIVSCTGIMPDARKAVSMQVKDTDLEILLIGTRKDECGGSLYYNKLEELCGLKTDTLLGKNVPQPDFKTCTHELRCCIEIVQKEIATATHDISEGGLLLAAFEMLTPHRKVASNIGMALNLDSLQSNLRTDTLLFSQTPGILIAVKKENVEKVTVIATSHAIDVFSIGHTTSIQKLTVERGEKIVVDLDLPEAISIWNSSLETLWK